MLILMRSFIARFRRDQSGLSAVEFAIILPIMLTWLLGSIEFANGYTADRKVTQTTSTLADLAAQDTNLTNAEINDIFAASAAVMNPINTSGMGMRITSVVVDAAGVAKVAWSDARNMSARSVGSTVTLPTGMAPPNGSVIFTETELNYSSRFGEFLSSGIVIKDKFYLRPRRSLKVTRSAT